MALKFLNKKGWHTGSLRNIEIVWKAEQKHEAEKRKLEELKKQILDEREAQEFRLLQEQAGLIPKQERLEFLYDSGLAVGRTTTTNTDDYLLGKPLEEKKEADDITKVAETPGALFVEEKPQSANDAWRKLHSDPLLLIRQQEQAALMRIKNNPIKMDLIKKSVQEKIAKKDKGKHKGERTKKHKDKKKKIKQEHDPISLNEPKISSVLVIEKAKEKERADNNDNKGTFHAKSTCREQSTSKFSRESEKPRRFSRSPERRRPRSPERKHYSSERKHDFSERMSSNPEKRRPRSPAREHYSSERKHDFSERMNGNHTSGTNLARNSAKLRKRHDSPDSSNPATVSTFSDAEHKKARVDISYEKEVHSAQAEASEQIRTQQRRKLTDEERQARLEEMQKDAEVHEEQRWHRMKKAFDADQREAKKHSLCSGRNFVSETARSIYGADMGNSNSVEESVRRRTHFIEKSVRDSNTNTFHRL